MADYEFRYRLNAAPTPTGDGSGMIKHAIQAVYRVDGSGDDWKTAPAVPARNKTIVIPASEMKVIMNMPHGNAAQKNAKNEAYKDALILNLHKGVEPIVGWDAVSLELMMDNNDDAILESGRVDNYIISTLNQEYPVPFNV